MSRILDFLETIKSKLTTKEYDKLQNRIAFLEHVEKDYKELKYKQEKKDELLELYIHAFNIFTKRNEITIKLEDRITLNEIFKNIKRLEEEMK